jgi:signal transduction histidine kinase
MQEAESKITKWQDWTVFGLYVLFLLGISVTVFLAQTPNGANEVSQQLMISVGGGLAVLAVLGTALLISSLRALIPYAVMVGGWVLTGIYLHLTTADPILLIGIAGANILIGTLYLGAMLGALHVVGIFAVTLGSILYLFGAEALDTLVTPYTPPILTLTLLTLVIYGWVYARSEYDQIQKSQLNRAMQARIEQLNEMRERSRAITEMSNTLSGTINFDKILDTVLDLGLLSLRKQANQRVVSMVLLFRSSDEAALHIVNSRGLNRNDDHKIIHSKQGIVGQTLRDCVPIIGKNANNDPELRSLAAFRNIRSVLCIPLRAHYDNYGVLLYGSEQPDAFDQDHIDALKAMGIQATVALQNSVLYNNLMEEKTRIIQMEEDARKSLVRDLHDIPTQTISAIAMRIRIIMRLMERSPGEVMDELKIVEDMALRATEEIRHVLFKLRPLVLESQGLTAALDQLAEKMHQTYGQHVSVKVGRDVEGYLDSNQQGALFYLIEEAVNNATKYAEAPIISVQVARQNERLMVRVADNGVGFDVDAVNAGYDDRGSFGMVNMRERAELMDGTVSIKSVPGRGTTVTVSIPIDTAKLVNNNSAEARVYEEMPMTKLAASARNSIEKMGDY